MEPAAAAPEHAPSPPAEPVDEMMEKAAATPELFTALITPAFKEACSEFLRSFATMTFMQPPEFYDVPNLPYNEDFYSKNTRTHTNPIYTETFNDLIFKGTEEDVQAYDEMWTGIIVDNRKKKAEGKEHLWGKLIFCFGFFTIDKLIHAAYRADKKEYISPAVATYYKKIGMIEEVYAWRCLRPAEEIAAERAAKEAVLAEARAKFDGACARYEELLANLKAIRQEMTGINHQLHEGYDMALAEGVDLKYPPALREAFNNRCWKCNHL